ncbi:MAG: hypothetical protein COA50_05800 [Flavobacteriaceae bacterium]|nr:MAG: hypothetical protein COA50_05800 [Flavobacteriaceae bacterium]
MIYRTFPLFFFLTVHFWFLSAQERQIKSFPNPNHEIGLPYIQNYSNNEYGAATDNWGTVQDNQGVLYFANGNGVLIYNGADWDLIPLPNWGSVLALAIDKRGRIYVGGANEMGYLESDASGKLNYVSLLPKLPQEYQKIDNIRKIYVTDEGIVFGSETSIYRWSDNKFKVWKLDLRSWTFYEKGILYVKMDGNGLMKLKNNQFELVEDGDFFKNMKLTTITSYDDEQLLISSKDRLFLYDGTNFTPFDTDIPSFFAETTIYNIAHLDDGTIAIGTLHNGILFVNRDGHKQIMLSKKGVLTSKQITYLFKDQSGLLWASTMSGITKIEYPSPFTFFNNNNNAPDYVVCFQRFNNKLYVASSEGLFFINTQNQDKRTILNKFDTNFGTITGMIIFKDKLLVGTGEGVYEIDKNETTRKIYSGRTQTLYVSKLDNSRVFVGLYPGITSIYNNDGHWEEEKVIEGISFRSIKLQEDKNGHLWLSTDKNEVGRISYTSLADAKILKSPKLKVFGAEDGVPDSRGSVYIIADDVYFKYGDGVYLFDSVAQRFNDDTTLLEKTGLQNKNVRINFVDEQENIWFIEYDEENYRKDQILAIKQDNGGYSIKRFHEKKIIDKRLYRPYPEFRDSIVWYRAKPGIIRHDLSEKALSPKTSKAIISSILWKNDSLIFGGYETSVVHQLSFKNNQLRFKYGSPNFYDESQNQFQVYLEGFDEDWSTWTSETQKDYTNIPGGDYVFKVRSKDIFHQIGEEDTYNFTILAPWYNTWWMYLIYGLLAAAIFMGISQYRSKELLRKNEALEGIIKSRTTEIQHKNELLNHQTEKLVQLNEARTQLYANITHEFRTPLTVILGMADTLKNKEQEESEKPLEMIKRNGKKLLRLVNEMLDLAKLESGNMTLQLVQTDIIPFVKYLSESFHSLAEERKINLVVYSEIDALEMDFDADKMASIISNLLSNAVKFTQEHGKIVVHLNKEADTENEYFIIKIQDNGLGISEEYKEHLFDRFYQVDNSSTKEKEGTGIGLSLVKEFVTLMNGTIDVESTLGNGSTFIVRIPKTNTAVKTVDAQIKVLTSVDIKQSVSTTKQGFINDTKLPLVLIIEDNEDVAYYLKTCLNGKYQALHALNGDMGIKMALEHIPDIIISDVMMPGKDGFEVCATLKTNELTDHIPIIMLTAKATDKDRVIGLSHGADAYLAKPFVKAELFTRLDQLVSLRQKMLRKFENNGFSKILKKKTTSPETKFLQKAIIIIHEQIDDSSFGATQLAFKLHLSESQVYRKLKAITDKSTAVFVRSIRLQKGKELIQTTDKNISEIAYEVGFNDPSWFSKAFKEEFGVAPSET